MKHLTPNQLFQLIDKTGNTGEIREYENHIEECPICKKALSLYKFTDNSIKEYPRQKTSFDFTENMVKNVLEYKKRSVVSRFISEKGFYLMGFLFFLILLNSMFNINGEISPDGSAEKNLTDSFTSGISNSIQQIFDQFSSFVQNIIGLIPASFGKTFFFAACTILILGLLDKILFKKFLKSN